MQWDSGTWNDISGIMYNASSDMTGVWTAISVVLCIVALVVGSRHELDAYKKAENGK